MAGTSAGMPQHGLTKGLLLLHHATALQNILYMCTLCAGALKGPMKAKKWCQGGSYRQLCAAMSMLGIELESSRRTDNSLNH